MSKSGLGCIVLFAVTLILGVALYTTCPTTADHRAVLSETVEQVINERLDSNKDDLMKKVINMLGPDALSETSVLAISQMLHVENYYFFSVGHIRYKDKDYRISFGVMGRVFAPDKNDLQLLMQQYGI